MSDRQGVEIDYCPQCRGVWLDRGELDKIIERSVPPAPAQGRPQAFDEPHRGSGQDPYRKKKRGGFLEDIFDF
jgi:Zn-finger nucleic acid-binding protein